MIHAIENDLQSTEHDHTHAQNRFAVIPIQIRLGIDDRFTGKGVTIAFLDSGFYPHPDLVEPLGRVKAFHDVTGEQANYLADKGAQSWMWHGTQTSVVAAGNGSLSDGVYRGLAPDASIVLVKVGDQHGRITEENIARGFEWVIENKERHDIRVINISLGGDEDVPCNKSSIDLAAEKAIENGIVVIAAAGNSGEAAAHHSIPPANSPSVITVGGYDDKNQLQDGKIGLYHSNYGQTADGTVKPEIIAPAMWVAAPILPGTEAYQAAEILSHMALAPDYELQSLARSGWQQAGLAQSIQFEEPSVIREAVESKLRRNKIVATHYQHVDGTSFAAPIVASIVAQMIEANTFLSPAAIKSILVSSADRLDHAPAVRQGYGVVNARRAVELASRELHPVDLAGFGPQQTANGGLIFLFHNDEAHSVALVADFNGWDHAQTPFKKETNGLWRAEVSPVPKPGRYRYKFVVNGDRWIDDPNNGYKEPDEFGGLNSIFNIEERMLQAKGDSLGVIKD